MGQRGPTPTPKKILEARGSWRAKLNPNEPTPERGKPNPPKSLPAKCRSVWDQICELLDGMGLLSKTDGYQLERYATYFVRWRECEEFIAKNGISYPIKSDDPACYVGKLPGSETAIVGFVEYPQVRESHRLDKALKQIEANFGLTPSARTRITIGDQREPEAGKARFFKTVG